VILLEDFAALLGLVFAFVAVGLALITENLYFDVLGTGLIGVLLVVVAVVLAVETKSLLIGEAAGHDAQSRIVAALTGTAGVGRIIHMKTLHLGPEELLVAAKIGVDAGSTADRVAAAIDAAEHAIRQAEPTAQVIYLEPDIYRADHQPADRPEKPAAPSH
jgi:divalent metal cation (Fe/Co/Zn/Cd) transporter